MRSFTYAEYLALALAKVWDNKAKLPSTETMWDLHWKRVNRYGGYVKHFQFLGIEVAHGQFSWTSSYMLSLITQNTESIRFFVGWLNDAAVRYGGRQVRNKLHGQSISLNSPILADWRRTYRVSSLAWGFPEFLLTNLQKSDNFGIMVSFKKGPFRILPKSIWLFGIPHRKWLSHTLRIIRRYLSKDDW